MNERYFANNIHTREAIIRAVFCLIRDKEFDDIKVEDIIANARVSRSTFYNYFEDKYDLRKYIQDEFLLKAQELERKLEDELQQKDDDSKILSEFYEENKELIFFLNKSASYRRPKFEDIKAASPRSLSNSDQLTQYLNNPLYRFHYRKYLLDCAKRHDEKRGNSELQAHIYAAIMHLTGIFGENGRPDRTETAYDLAKVTAKILRISPEELCDHLIKETKK